MRSTSEQQGALLAVIEPCSVIKLLTQSLFSSHSYHQPERFFGSLFSIRREIWKHSPTIMMIQGITLDSLGFLRTWLLVLTLSSQSEYQMPSLIKTVDRLFLHLVGVSFCYIIFSTHMRSWETSFIFLFTYVLYGVMRVYRYIYFTSNLIFCLIINCSYQSVFFKTIQESHMLRICFPLVLFILLHTSHCRKVTSPTKFCSVHNFHTVNSHNHN